MAGNTNAVGKTTLHGQDNSSHKDMISSTMDDMKNTDQTLFQQYFHSELNKASQPRIGISQQP